MFDPRDPYERYYWHYESRRPLSVAQIIALQSVDTWTAALVWVLLEHGASLTVAGPTDPQPGVGKTTTLNALLQFLPEGTAIAYMSGMYERFEFTKIPEINPATTYALCNEVSDHLPIYMWGRIARQYLQLPSKGFHIATSVHADEIDDVLQMYQGDLRLSVHDVRRLGLVINIGPVGRGYPMKRRWLSTHFIQPTEDPARPEAVLPIMLSRWQASDDTFEHADEMTLEHLANWIELSADELAQQIKARQERLEQLAQGSGVGPNDMFDAISELREESQK